MKFHISPWKHQLEAIRHCKDVKNYALFFEQGTGKTMTAINILRTKFIREQRIKRTLILTPRIVVPNWEKEFHLHSRIPKDRIFLLQGPGAKREILFNAKAFRHKPYGVLGLPAKNGHIFITNYEALTMKNLFYLFMQWMPEILILDESHKCKSQAAKRTKKAVELSKVVEECYLLTGTPMPNGMMDLFTQFRILDKGETFGENFYQWRHKYFYDKNWKMPKQHHFPDWVPKPHAARALNKKISAKSMRVTKDECLDLPPLVKQVMSVELSPEQARTYKQMKKEYITFINNKKGQPEAVVANMALTKGLRLQQILSGFVKTDEGSTVRFKKNPRMDALKELLVDLAPDHKVIVWAVFKENYAMIREVCESAKIKYVEVHGEVKDVEKDKNVVEFNDNDDCRVFIGNPVSGGIGINLTASDIAIFYSRNFSLEADLQAEARNHRGGSERHQKITRIDLCATGTLDEKIMEALAGKEKISEKVLTQSIRSEQ